MIFSKLRRLINKYTIPVAVFGLSLINPVKPLKAAVDPVTIRWNQNSEQDLKDYLIYIKKSGGDWNLAAVVDKAACVLGRCSCQLTNLEPDTLYQFKLRARDFSGNESADSAIVQKVTSSSDGGDHAAPILKVNSLSDITTDGVYKLSGSVMDHSATQILINGNSVPVNPDGSWSYDLVLAEGYNDVTIEAKDAFNNVTLLGSYIVKDSEAPVTGQLEMLFDGSNLGLKSSYSDITSVYATLFINDTPVENFTLDESGDFSIKDIPLKVWQNGENKIKLVLEDEAGNTSTLEKIINITKAYTLVEDGEYESDADIKWACLDHNRGADPTLSLDLVIEGKSSIKFPIKTIENGKRALWDMYLDDLLDLNKAEETRLSVYNSLDSHALGLAFYYHSAAGGWFKYFKYLDHGWNNIVIPNDAYTLEGSGHDLSQIDRIRFSVYNTSGGLIIPEAGKDFVLLDRLLLFKPLAVVDLNYASTNEAQENWHQILGAGPVELIPDDSGYGNSYLRLPANLSDYWRNCWDVNIADNFSNVKEFRLLLHSDNPQEGLLHSLLYFRNVEGTWYKYWADFFEGDNLIIEPKTGFLQEGSHPGWEEINRIRYCTCTNYNRTYDGDANTILKGIGINDLLYFYVIK